MPDGEEERLVDQLSQERANVEKLQQELAKLKAEYERKIAETVQKKAEESRGSLRVKSDIIQEMKKQFTALQQEKEFYKEKWETLREIKKVRTTTTTHKNSQQLTTTHNTRRWRNILWVQRRWRRCDGSKDSSIAQICLYPMTIL